MEAVACDEQGLPLTSKQEKALKELICFSEEEDEERIRYVGERARPSRPWHEILTKTAPYLISSLSKLTRLLTLFSSRAGPV